MRHPAAASPLCRHPCPAPSCPWSSRHCADLPSIGPAPPGTFLSTRSDPPPDGRKSARACRPAAAMFILGASRRMLPFGPMDMCAVPIWPARDRHLGVLTSPADAHIGAPRARRRRQAHRRRVRTLSAWARSSPPPARTPRVLALAMHGKLKPFRHSACSISGTCSRVAPSGILASTSNRSDAIQSGPETWYGFTR